VNNYLTIDILTVDVNEGEYDSSDFSDGDPDGMSGSQKRSPPSIPFASRKSREN
jgi:hypothetical protein